MWWLYLTIFVGAFSVYFGSLPYLFDFGQCERACKVRFGGSNNYHVKDTKRKITGFWTLTDRLGKVDRCYCEEIKDTGAVQLGDIPRLNQPEEEGFPYIWRDSSVCGKDGKVYKSASEARKARTNVLHCGPHCGDCSTVQDVKRYHEIGKDVSKVVGPCVLSYLLFGEYLDYFCMSSRARFTDPCNACWIKDHGCLASHCFYSCVFKGSKHWQRLLGVNKADDITESTDPCVHCMEKLCSAPFIRTCGVNRRVAGVQTDLGREDREICKDSVYTS
jgi:hypothetical protein